MAYTGAGLGEGLVLALGLALSDTEGEALIETLGLADGDGLADGLALTDTLGLNDGPPSWR